MISIAVILNVDPLGLQLVPRIFLNRPRDGPRKIGGL